MASSTNARLSLWSALSILLLSQTLASRMLASAACFFPNGAPATSDYVSCNGTAGVSSCCSSDDSCTTSGMCLSRKGYVYRGGCTDATWGSDLCPQLCRASRPETWTGLWTCPYPNATAIGTWNYYYCCGEQEPCCNKRVSDRATLDIGYSFTAGTDRTIANLSSDLASLGGGPNGTNRGLNGTTMYSDSDYNRLRASLGAGLGVPFALTAIALIVVSILLVKERRHSRLYSRSDNLVGPSPVGSTRSNPEMTQRTFGSDTGPSIDSSPTATNQPGIGRMDTVNHTNGTWMGRQQQQENTGLPMSAWAGQQDTALPSMMNETDGAVPRRQPTSNGRGWIRPPASDETLSPASAGAENSTMDTIVAPPPAELGSDSQPERAELWGSEKK